MNAYDFHEALPLMRQKGRVLKSTDHRLVATAMELLEKAKIEAQKRQQEAEMEWKLQQEIGYHQGSEKARREGILQHWTIIANTVIYLNLLQEQMAETIVEAVRVIIQEIPTSERVLQLAAAAVERLRQQAWVVLCVNPEDIDGVNILLEGWKKMYLPQQMRVETRASEEVESGNCVLESPIGRIDASLETQLQVIQEQMRGIL